MKWSVKMLCNDQKNSNFSKWNLKTNFISQCNIVPTFIWSIGYSSQVCVYWVMMLPENHPHLFYGWFCGIFWSAIIIVMLITIEEVYIENFDP